MQLGTFDFASFSPAAAAASAASSRTASGNHGQAGLLPAATAQNAETLAWPESARHAYGRNFVNQSTSAISAGRIRGLRGSSLRNLHNAVFDVMDGSCSGSGGGVVRVGLGAGVYGFVGRWMPRGLVSWMMGVRRVDDLVAWQQQSESYGSSPRSVGSDGVEGSQDFVSVPLEHVGDSHVWKEG